MGIIEPDEIIYSRRKTIAVTVFPGGRVVVRAPAHASQAVIRRFLSEKAEWIQTAQAKMQQAAQQPGPDMPYREHQSRTQQQP